MVDNITPPTPDKISDQQMYRVFESPNPLLSHSASAFEQKSGWRFDTAEQAEQFVAFLKRVGEVEESKIAVAEKGVAQVLEGVEVGRKPSVTVTLQKHVADMAAEKINSYRVR